MIDIPDAPWIRDAERNGMPEAEDFTCPVCGNKNPDRYFIDRYGDVIGCEACISTIDAYDYTQTHKEE